MMKIIIMITIKTNNRFSGDKSMLPKFLSIIGACISWQLSGASASEVLFQMLGSERRNFQTLYHSKNQKTDTTMTCRELA